VVGVSTLEVILMERKWEADFVVRKYRAGFLARRFLWRQRTSNQNKKNIEIRIRHQLQLLQDNVRHTFPAWTVTSVMHRSETLSDHQKANE
jgi:hypothetical protein